MSIRLSHLAAHPSSSFQSMQLSIPTNVIPDLPYCWFGCPMSYPDRLARLTARLVVHECRLGLTLNKWASFQLVPNECPDVLAGSSLSRMAGDP